MSTPTPGIEAQFAQAQALWELSDVARAEDVLRAVLARDPGHEDASFLLARALQTGGRLDAAARTIFDLCRARGFPAELGRRAAQFIQLGQRQAVAADLCQATLDRGHSTPALLAVAGNLARELGDFARARGFYLAALDAGVDLDVHYVLGALAHTLRYEDAAHPDFARFEVHLRDGAASPRAHAATGFGLAKARDDLGDHESAARVLREANARVRSVLPWSADAWDAAVEARCRERITCAPVPARSDFVPVFVVGLPRTGTTLAASRLAQASVARDRGELRMLRFIAGQLIGGGHLGDAAALEEAAALYRVHARQDDAPATWYIDQDPLNYQYLHVVEALFPNARIIHCVRERRDTALSLWSQDFAHAECAFAFDFEGIARYAAGHDRLMRHWHRTLSLPIHTLAYEDLVADPVAAVERLRVFAGVPAAATGATHAAPIVSASVWQARQPVYARSVGRWRRYAPFVPELDRFARAD